MYSKLAHHLLRYFRFEAYLFIASSCPLRSVGNTCYSATTVTPAACAETHAVAPTVTPGGKPRWRCTKDKRASWRMVVKTNGCLLRWVHGARHCEWSAVGPRGESSTGDAALRLLLCVLEYCARLLSVLITIDILFWLAILSF